MGRFVLAIDQGTTGSTVLVIDETQQVRGRATREFSQHYPQPGWVEHNPEEIWQSVVQATAEALASSQLQGKDITAIGITNQRETTLLWERATGRPVAPAIVWQDRRTAQRCAELRAAGWEAELRQLTGLVPDPYFCATKLEWLLASSKPLASRAANGELAFGTVDSFLVARLTGNARHVTDITNASRTLLYNIHERRWDDRLCELFKVDPRLLPEVLSSAATFGITVALPEAGLPAGIPICGMAGDQQAALFGQACFAPGEAKCTYGTGAFLLLNTGTLPVASPAGLLTTIAWQLGGQTTYALEGSVFMAGALVQWLRDGLGIIATAGEVETLARQVEDTAGVTIVPAFVGLGAPHWRPDARGIITGLTRGAGRAHLARAALEAIALQNVDVLAAMELDAQQSGDGPGAKLKVARLKVDGGAAKNDLLMQLQADLLGVELVRPAMVETTALGAALLAGLGAGIFKDLRQISDAWRPERTFVPAMPQAVRAAHMRRWQQAVERA